MRKTIQRVLAAASALAFFSILGVAGAVDMDPGAYSTAWILTQLIGRALAGTALLCLSKGLDDPYQDA